MANPITIIPAKVNHYNIIRQIAHTTWPVTFGEILSPTQIGYMLDWMYSLPAITQQVNEKQHVFLLATDGQTYYGYASYELNYQDSGKVKVHKIYILPEAQGKGVGRLLMDAIAAVAKEHRFDHLVLNVNRSNKAIQFYKHYGFVITGEEDIDIGNGFLMEDYIMEKTLNNT